MFKVGENAHENAVPIIANIFIGKIEDDNHNHNHNNNSIIRSVLQIQRVGSECATISVLDTPTTS